VIRVFYSFAARIRSAVLTVVIVSGYGVFDEFRQSFTPGRSVEIADWVADTAGAVVAASLYAFVPAWRSLLEARPARRGARGSASDARSSGAVAEARR
jgi:VanZ family protein